MGVDGPGLGLAEELVLICADAADGRVRSPQYFSRVLGAAVLSDLQLAGAISVEGRRITGAFRVPVGGPGGAELLERIGADLGPRGAGTLDRWIRRASRSAFPRALGSLEARGLVVARQKPVLFGLMRTTEHHVTAPEYGRAAADRVLRELRQPGDPRTRHLAGLLHEGRLARRVFGHGREQAAVRRELKDVAKSLPIAAALHRVIRRDRSSDGGD